MTNSSTPASTTVLQCSSVRAGDRAAATVTPASRICSMRAVMSSGLMGSA
jgi:hypothetical protein